jgi:hypothetical protein
MTFEFDRALIFNALPKARLVRISTNQPIFIAGPLRVQSMVRRFLQRTVGGFLHLGTRISIQFT